MAANYGRNLYKQLEEALTKIDTLIDDNVVLKQEIVLMKSNHAKDISALRTEHRKEIKVIHSEYNAKIGELNSKITTLKDENQKLRSQIDKNSSNSSKPPSSDGFKKIHSTREKTDKKPGGQKGHKGNVPIMFENPDEVIDLREALCGCGGQIDYSCNKIRKQVAGIVMKVHIKEYISGDGICAICGKKHLPKFPKHVHNPVNIDVSLRTLTAMLHGEYAMPLNKIKQFISDMTKGKLKISEGTIVNACKELSFKINPSIESIKEKLFLSPVMHKDETGIKICGKQNWLHTLTTAQLTLYLSHEKRGNIADQEMGVLKGYSGTLVHDHLKGLYSWNCAHAECNAHLIRYLKSVISDEPEYEAYASEILTLITRIHTEKKEAIKRGETKFHNDRIALYSKRYDDILSRWNSAIFEICSKLKKGNRRYKREGEKLCPRLVLYKDEHLLFMNDFKVPFDNNLAERSLRSIKTKTKVSGGFRTKSGGECYAKTRSYIETLRRQKKNIYEGICLAFAGKPVIF